MQYFVRLALLAAALALSACAGSNGPITRGEIFLQIPFEDAPEGAGIDVVTHKTKLVPADEWRKMVPTMLMIPAKYWTDIKIGWLKACRLAGPDCNVQVESIDKAVRALDELLKKIIPLPVK